MRLRDRLTPGAIIKELALYTRLRNRAYPIYGFMFEPAQLCYLCGALSSVAGVPGAVLEVGCAFGNTTIFLNKHMDAEGTEKPYYAVDTFGGFVPEHVAFERSERGKTDFGYQSKFAINDIRWFRETMRVNRISRVQAYEADAERFGYARLQPFAFVLIDVDLYLPVARALTRVWSSVSSGGIVIVDDCKKGGEYDGALQAYLEFTEANDLPKEIVAGKLGILHKP